jgi:peptide/nickel transport system permease protein
MYAILRAIVLRLVVYRLLWSLPTLAGIFLAVFAAVTMLPDSRERGSDVAARRAHFLDLPRFYHPRPVDVRGRTDAAIADLQADEEHQASGARELARLGGAGLPYVLPLFHHYSPAIRERIAMALAPVAARMGKFEPGEYDNPARAVGFWARFWEDHAIDFSPTSRRRAVERLVAHGGTDRARELRLLDTYVLEELIPVLARTTRRDSLSQLSQLASRATGQSMQIADNARPEEIVAIVASWQNFWFIYEGDFVALDGPARVTASLSATRYGKWLIGTLTGRLTMTTGEQLSLGERLSRRFFVTFGLIVAALLVTLSIAVPFGVISAYRRGRSIDRIFAALTFLLYSIPAFVLSQALASVTHGGVRALAAAAVLTAGSLAAMSRTQRSAMLEMLNSDYVRTARAKGASELRVLVVHALRNAMMPVIALVSIQLPSLLGGALVVEEAFGLQGLGWETLRALERNDLSWIVLAVLAIATMASLALVFTDVVYAVVDPRVKFGNADGSVH